MAPATYSETILLSALVEILFALLYLILVIIEKFYWIRIVQPGDLVVCFIVAAILIGHGLIRGVGHMYAVTSTQTDLILE